MQRKILSLTILAVALSLSVTAQAAEDQESAGDLPSLGEDVIGYEFMMKGTFARDMSEEKEKAIERAVEKKIQGDRRPGERTRFRQETDSNYNVSLDMDEAEEIARENLTDYSWQLEDKFLDERMGRYRFFFEIDTSRYEGSADMVVDASSGKITRKNSRFIDQKAREKKMEKRYREAYREEITKRTNGSIMLGGFIGFSNNENEVRVETARDGETEVFRVYITAANGSSSDTKREKIRASMPADYGENEVRLEVFNKGEEVFTTTREITVPDSFEYDRESTRVEIEKMPALSMLAMMNRIRELRSQVGQLRKSNREKDRRYQQMRQKLQEQQERRQPDNQEPEPEPESEEEQESESPEQGGSAEQQQQDTREEQTQPENEQNNQDTQGTEEQQENNNRGQQREGGPGIIGSIGSVLTGFLG